MEGSDELLIDLANKILEQKDEQVENGVNHSSSDHEAWRSESLEERTGVCSEERYFYLSK